MATMVPRGAFAEITGVCNCDIFLSGEVPIKRCDGTMIQILIQRLVVDRPKSKLPSLNLQHLLPTIGPFIHGLH